MSDNNISGFAQLDSAAALMFLGTIHESPYAVIKEMVDNAADAGAKTINIVIDNATLTIIDDGFGMIGNVHPMDVPIITQYRQWMAEGTVPIGYDLRDHVSPATLKSLQWMIEHTALSPKRPQAGERMRGMRGIGGTLGWRMIANAASWKTRPDIDLYRELVGPEFKDQSRIPTYTLVPPTTEQLRAHYMGYKLVETREGVLNEAGSLLKSGTRVELSQFHADVLPNIRAGALATYLGNSFAEDIRERRLEITVYDRRRNSVPVTRVEAPSISRGILLVDKTLEVRGYPFRVNIRIDPTLKQANAIQLVRKGENVRRLTELPEFDRHPFNAAGTLGSVEFPDVPESLATWSTDKKTPDVQGGQLRRQWAKRVIGLSDEIEEKLKEIQAHTKERRVKQLAPDLAQAAVEAMQDMDTFRDLVITPPTRGVRKNPRKPAQEPTKVTVRVIKEHNLPVEGAGIILRGTTTEKERIVKDRLTGRSGRTTFGELPFGHYTIQLATIPEGAKLQGEPQFTFNINENTTGINWTFVLKTGAPPPERRKLPFMEILFRPFDDDQQPYSTARLGQGMLEINQNETHLSAALDQKDDQKLYTLLAMYVACAVTEFSQAGDPAYLLTQAALLGASIYQNLRERVPTRKR